MTTNILANVVGRAWGVISVYLFVPVYLKFLGIEAYGLVGFYSLLIGVVAFADAGFTATLNREMARLSVLDDTGREMGALLRTYEILYGLISLMLSLAIWFTAPIIAARWLRSNTLGAGDIIASIRLMGLAVAFQLPAGLYIGGLMGLQRQIVTNLLQMSWSLLRGLGAVFVLWLLSPTIQAFLLWQLVSNVVYCYGARSLLWRSLSCQDFQPAFEWVVVRKTWRYAAGMAGMAGISILLTQVDKVIVSKTLSLEIFGFYTLASTVAMAPLMLASPIGAAVSPRFTGLVAKGDRAGLISLYHNTCALVAVAVIPAGLTLALFAADFILAWTGSGAAAARAGFVAALLLAGQLMQAVAIVPYYVALAHGDVRLYLYIGILSVVALTPLMIILIAKVGIVGAGLSWLIMNVCTLPFYLFFIHKRFLAGELRRWYMRDIGLPLVATLPCVLVGRWLLPHSASRVVTLCGIGFVWAGAVVLSVLCVAPLRQAVRDNARRLRGLLDGN